MTEPTTTKTTITATENRFNPNEALQPANGFDGGFGKKLHTILNSEAGEEYYRERLAGAVNDNCKPTKGSRAEARALRRQLLFRLGKYGIGEAEEALLIKLSRCKRWRRCADAACPLCTYAVQALMSELHGDMREGGIRFDACITIIPRLRFKPTTEPGRGIERAVAKVMRARQRFDEAYEASGVTAVIGAVDFTYHEFPDGSGFADHCRPHHHGLGFKAQLTSGDKQLRGRFPSKGSVSRPVQVQDFDGNDAWLQYALKTPNSRNIRRKDDQGRWLPSTYKTLTVGQHLQQAMVLHEIGWAGRIYLRGIDLIEGERGWRLSLTEFKPAVQQKGGRRRS